MPYYEFKCKACGNFFDLQLEKEANLEDVHCPSCFSEKYSIEHFDRNNHANLRKIWLKVQELELRLNKLFDELDPWGTS